MMATSSFASAAMYAKIDGIKGDVDAPMIGGTDGWFKIDSFDFGVENDRKKGKESGEKGGTADINIGVGELKEVSITKSMDSASADLAQFAINGNSPGTADICFVDTGGSSGTPVCYLRYKLDRVFVKSWSTSGDADDRPTEEVAFYYNKIAFAYASTNNADGKFQRDGTMAWDNVKNVPWTDILETIWDLIFPQPEPSCPEQCQISQQMCIAEGRDQTTCNEIFEACNRMCAVP